MINLELFFLASLLLIIIPGNDMVFAATNTLKGGFRQGVAACIGIGLGSFVHTLIAALGISVLLKVHPELFMMIKIAGACYLFFLGGKILIQKQSKLSLQSGMAKSTSVIIDGLLTNLLNPKVALFFLAFLPQFVEMNSPNFFLYIVILGVTFDVLGTSGNLVICWLINKIGSLLQSAERFQFWQSKITGFIFILLGIGLLFQQLG